MCTTAFHSGIVCHVPDSFPEIFRRKTLRKQKTKKNKKKQFSRGIGKQKSAKPKKPRENPQKKKKKKKQYSRSLGEGGGQTRDSKYCFFCFFFVFLVFSRFFWFCTFLLSKTSGIFFFFGFFWFSRGFCTFSKGPSPKILKMSFLICSSRLYFSFVYCYAFFGRNSALMLLFFISFVAFHI